MRLIGRSAPDRPLAPTAANLEQLRDANIPIKTEAVFDARSNRHLHTKSDKHRQGASHRHVPNVEQKSLRNPLRVEGALRDTQDAMPRRLSSGTKDSSTVWAEESSMRSMDDFFYNGLQPTRTRPDIPPRRTSTKAVDSHYDAARQPLFVSQQTSNSAVRDMALRKTSLMIHEASSDPTLGRRPLKSAMKKSPEAKKHPDAMLRPTTSGTPRRPSKLDLLNFFPQPRRDAAAHGLLSPNRMARSPSALTDASDIFPKETVQVKLKRPTANAPFESYKSVKPASINSESTTRAKVLEPDIFGLAKTNVRRPPKGAKNWFDSFDISSDEESEAETPPQELPADEKYPGGHEVPTDLVSWIKPESEQPEFNRKMSTDPVQDNLLAIENARERLLDSIRAAEQRATDQRRGSNDAGTIASFVSRDRSTKKSSGESKLAGSKLNKESVLSLSDSSGEEQMNLPPIRGSVADSSIIVDDAVAVDIQHSMETSRKLHNKRGVPRESFPRQSTSTMQTSGSIPIKLTDSTIPNISGLPSPPSIPPQTSYFDSTAQALRKLNGMRDSTSQPSGSRVPTQASMHEYANSAGGDTTSSMPNDAAHMMAVTEEEMLLLEMMRNKRAAMQKNSFAEGYQLALTREQEHLAKRRESAQQTAMKILRQRQEKAKSPREGRVESVAEGSLTSLDQQRKKYSMLSKEDVDKTLKLERFFASDEMPLEDAFPEPPSRRKIVEQPRPPQKFDLLQPSTYSPVSSRVLDEPVSDGAGDSSPVLNDEDIEDHHDRVRQFLRSHTPDTANTLATRTTNSRSNLRRENRKSMLSSSPVTVAEEEEPMMPEIPERSPHRPTPPPGQTRERRRSISGRRLSNHQIDTSSLSERASPLPTLPSKPAADSPAHSPYHLLPNIDFTPLDFPISHAASPSLSTSRASPLTPTFNVCPVSEKPGAGPSIASSDNASLRGRRTYTPDTDLTSLSASASMAATPHSGKKRPGLATKRSRPQLNVVPVSGFNTGRGSVTSMTSAGADVLAAWAELGGGSEALAPRIRMR